MNHEQLFTDTSLACAQLITRRYSTSFSLGIRTLDKSLHRAIYAIYGFVRWADEIVDTFHSHDKATLLATFEHDTYAAIAVGFSLNPVLHAFQWAVIQRRPWPVVPLLPCHQWSSASIPRHKALPAEQTTS